MNDENTLTFTELLKASTTNLSSGASLSFADIFVGLFATLICSLIISWVYKNAYQGVLYQKSFNLSLILAALITTSIIMVISGNLILSLGMVGALSIVRFRAAIKDPLDIVFMFWSISIGIANGVANIKVSLVATLFVSVIILVLTRIPFKQSAYMMIIKFDKDLESQITDLIKASTARFRTKSMSYKGSQIELIGEIRLKKGMDISEKMNSIDPNIEVNLIAYNDSILDSN
jgi:hypothetical protein